MKKYFAIYGQLLKLNFSNLTSYRSNFVNNMLSAVAWGIFTFGSVVLLTLNVSKAYGWKREEIILLSGAYSIMIGIFHTIFSRNFERMSTIINLGQLDYVLVKPVDSQFLLSFWFVNYTMLIRLPMGFAIIWYALRMLGTNVDIVSVLWFIAFMILGILLLYSIWFMVATLTIWYTRISNIVDLMFSVSSIARFPREMISNFNEYLFIILLPITFVMIPSTRFLLHKASLTDTVVLTLFSIIFLWLSRKFWKFALRFYTSASS